MSSPVPASASDSSPQPWIIRISDVFAPIAAEVLKHFGADSHTALGAEFYSIKTLTPEAIRSTPASIFARWNLPLQHTWPCNPQKMEGFIEKASQTLLKKFGPQFPQQLLIGQLNPVFWSFCGFIPNAARLVEEMLPRLVERVRQHQVQAALLIPASRLCHQSVSLIARALEEEGMPTMTLGVAKEVVQSVRPPRTAYYDGELGSVAGLPDWPEYQRRILDEALRLIEPMDQPGIRKLGVEMQSLVEKARGER